MSKRESIRALNPTASYIEQSELMMRNNYDPYRELVWQDLEPKDIERKPSFWKKLKFTFFPKVRD